MTTPPDTNDPSRFGANVWVVEEMYRRYKESPESVSAAWQEFFSDYRSQLIGAPDADAIAAPMPTAVTESPASAIEGAVPLVGTPAVISARMDESLSVPTATSVRTMPSKLVEVNRQMINDQLARLATGAKVSFTHLISWAVIRAMKEQPVMRVGYAEIEGAPQLVRFPHLNLGIAVDTQRKDGTRTLSVPNLKAAEEMSFRAFWLAYEDLIRRVRSARVTPDDFAGTTATITNPGMIGTVQSVPRLMAGQGVIVGIGSLQYPPEYEGSDPRTIARLGIGRTLTLTSTYDHRVIQGAQSGEFLRRIEQLLLGADDFYQEIFSSLGVPYVPARWSVDNNPAWESEAWAEKQARVFQLINIYRVRGHLMADLDPLRLATPSLHSELDPLSYGLTIWDLDRQFPVDGLGGHRQLELGKTLSLLRDAYCRTIGIEYMHIQIPAQKRWIQERVEVPAQPADPAQQLRILDSLNRAEAFERFLHTKYVGHKRYGLEGAETLITLLVTTLDAAAEAGMDEVVIGMAHRGRLSVLANVVGKSYDRIFREFEGHVAEESAQGSGDVKYHLGSIGTHAAVGGRTITVEVAPNPSHLEAVDPVLEGMVRAKQDRLGADGAGRVLPLLVHGDAAFAGQGVVFETLNLSQLPGYRTGGTVHAVVNNQVGFTTDAAEARSSFYATDIAKAVQAPIFHVNGDDPEAVARVARLAFEFRQAFAKDVVIDLVCYRRFGHNEADDPTFTQPVMYRAIEARRSVRKLYLEQLVNRGQLSLEEGEQQLEAFGAILRQALAETREMASRPARTESREVRIERPTAVDPGLLNQIEARIHAVPGGFQMHPKLEKVFEARGALFREGTVDWSLAEALAFGSLAIEGTRVRLAGEDSRRGTFSQRHAVLSDYRTGVDFSPLSGLSPSQAPLEIVDSLLSEFAALGFEYGYAVEAADALVAWEAQFGDFANGAQVIIDNFVVAGEDKWGEVCGLTLLLPHGYEGQGPEHSSARLERFLAACAGDNLRIVVPSTSASYFHALRRQARAGTLKPAVILSPKSLLRTRESYGSVAELSQAGFRSVIPDASVGGSRRVILCSGKVFYELAAHRSETGESAVALVRIEQLYPFPEDELRAAIEAHGMSPEVFWVQEEPENMGAWGFLEHRLRRVVNGPVGLVSRPESPSPATGSYRLHLSQQQELVRKAFA